MKNKIILISYLMPPINPGVTNLHFIDGKLRKEVFHRGWGWTYRFSEHLQKLRPEYDIECWNCYSPQDYHDMGVYSKSENGILFTQFPVTKIGNRSIPLSLFREFRTRLNHGEKFIAHHQSLNKPSSNLLAFLFPKAKNITQQRGGDIPPEWKLKFKRKLVYIFEKWFYNFTHSKFNYIITSSIGGWKYGIDKLGKERVVYSKGGGFDFALHKLKSKTKLRKELDLPLDKKLIIFVGKFRNWRNKDKFGGGSGKGLGVALESYKILKDKHKNIEMVFIGGAKTSDQDLYKAVASSGGIMRHYMPHADAMKYINAADILLLPTEDKEWIPFGDIPSCIVDALSVNTPVVSPMLIHFSGTKSERKKLGLITHNIKEVISAIEQILANPEDFADTRSLMKKYYSWDNIIKNNSKVYDSIFSEING